MKKVAIHGLNNKLKGLATAGLAALSLACGSAKDQPQETSASTVRETVPVSIFGRVESIDTTERTRYCGGYNSEGGCPTIKRSIIIDSNGKKYYVSTTSGSKWSRIREGDSVSVDGQYNRIEGNEPFPIYHAGLTRLRRHGGK